jgi:hypothetical protein
MLERYWARRSDVKSLLSVGGMERKEIMSLLEAYNDWLLDHHWLAWTPSEDDIELLRHDTPVGR